MKKEVTEMLESQELGLGDDPPCECWLHKHEDFSSDLQSLLKKHV